MPSRKSRRASHDPAIISILEIVGAYFVDKYYNDVYATAAALVKRSGGSLTDEYVRSVKFYIVGVKSDEKSYHKIVQELHEFFKKKTSVTLTFPDFVERIITKFVPKEYHDLYQDEEKDETLGSIIADLVSGLGVYVTKEDILRRIIDMHESQFRVTIRMIQDHALTLLLSKRTEIHNKYLQRVGQTRGVISIEVVDGLKKTIRKLLKEKVHVQSRLDEAEDYVDDLKAKVAAMKGREAKYRRLIELLQIEVTKGARAAAAAASLPPHNRYAEKPRLRAASDDEDPPDNNYGEAGPPDGGDEKDPPHNNYGEANYSSEGDEEDGDSDEDEDEDEGSDGDAEEKAPHFGRVPPRRGQEKKPRSVTFQLPKTPTKRKSFFAPPIPRDTKKTPPGGGGYPSLTQYKVEKSRPAAPPPSTRRRHLKDEDLEAIISEAVS